MTKTIRTTCAYCGVGCGIVATIADNGDVDIAGDENHPANYGRLCGKGASLADTLTLHDRLLYPEVAGRRETWSNAINLVASRFKQTIERYGPDSVAFYVSGQLLTEDYYLANKLMKGFIGSGNIDTNSRLCMASSVAGHKRAFGEDVVPGVYSDIELADIVILIGSNLAWCHPVLHQRLLEARIKKGTKIVVIDPRATATTGVADMHLALRAGTDVALFNGLLKYLIDHSHHNERYIAQHCDGFENAKHNAESYDLTTVSDITGLPTNELIAFYQMFAATPASVSIYSQGVNQSTSGSDKVNAIINLHLATGRIGKPGCGPFSVTGQPNAMGGRETGGLANMLAAHIDFDDVSGAESVRKFWNAPSLATKSGLKAVELFDEIANGTVKALWVMATNPAVSISSSKQVQDAIEKCDFVVVSDIVKHTDTALGANVLLPAAGWGEKDGTVTNSERCISRQRQLVPFPGEVRPDWWMIAEVAKKMGYGSEFEYSGAAAIFREYAAMTGIKSDRDRALDISPLAQISEQAFDALHPARWPLRNLTKSNSGERLYTDGRFSTPNGKAKFIETAYRPPHSVTSTDYPFILNSGRIRDQWHTMTRSLNSSQLSNHIAEPYVEINPVDAKRLAIQDAELVTVAGHESSILVRALITERTVAGNLFVPMHWSAEYSSKARVNELIASEVDPVSGQPELKYAAVSAHRFPGAWYGFAALRDWQEPPKLKYWARMRTESGWRVELANDVPERDYTSFFFSFGQFPESVEVLKYEDKTRGLIRLLAVQDNLIVGAFFAASEPVKVARTEVLNYLGKPVDTADVALLFTGNRPGKTNDEGAIICSCHLIGANTIRQAVIEGATTVNAVGSKTAAGTNCGSCRMEIQQIINTTKLRVAV